MKCSQGLTLGVEWGGLDCSGMDDADGQYNYEDLGPARLKEGDILDIYGVQSR
jgi:hypothetical protein